MKNRYIVIFGLVCVLFLISTVYLLEDNERLVDRRTKILCREYANRDHEKEFSPERWKLNKEWIEKFDWYGSCIDHVKYPVAK